MQQNLIESANGTELSSRLRTLLLKDALIQKDVVLASGKPSQIYFDCRQIYFRGEAQFIIGELFFKKMRELESLGKFFSACGGMAMGAIPLVAALSSAAFRRGRELPGCVVRKEVKEHGLSQAIEGGSFLHNDCAMLLVEDVVTTGGSVLRAAQVLREAGAKVDTLLCLIDREQGGAVHLADHGISLHPLFTMSEF